MSDEAIVNAMTGDIKPKKRRFRKKRLYYKTEQEFMESVTKTPQTQLTTICLAVRYNIKNKVVKCD